MSDRPVVGPLMIFVGAVHIAITPLIFPSSVQSIVEGGVIASIEADPEQAGLRGFAFWYASRDLPSSRTGSQSPNGNARRSRCR